MATNAEIETKISDALEDAASTGVKRYTTADGRSVERFEPSDLIDALKGIRGLTSSKRGFNLAKSQRPK